MLLTRLRPHLFLPCLALMWGTFAALMGATKNWSQVAAMRFLLGVAEVRRSERICLYIYVNTAFFFCILLSSF